MRLICPNCDAQYDVSDDAIPSGGRDVQCSNCKHTWFQTEKPVVPGRETTRVLAPSRAQVVSEPRQVSVPVPVSQPRKPQLDAAVTDILRAEALREQEMTVEKTTAAPPPTQAATKVHKNDADETRKRVAQMTEDEGGTGADAAAAVGAPAMTQANLRTVPDIHEINAALRARAQANEQSGLTDAEKQQAVQRGGFRRGFFFVLLVFVVLFTPYLLADEITRSLPQTRAFMAPYVETVDQLRLWLAMQSAALNDLITGFMGS